MASEILQHFLSNSFTPLPELIRQKAQERVLKELTDKQVATDLPVIQREIDDRIQAATDRLNRSDARIKAADEAVDREERLLIQLDGVRKLAYHERDKDASAEADSAYSAAEKARNNAQAERRAAGIARSEAEQHLAKLQAALAQLRSV